MLHHINAIYSPESISFQNMKFRDTLVEAFDKYRTSSVQDVRSELELAITDAIKMYTNINIDTQIGNYQMSIEVPQIDKNSPLLEGYGFAEVATSKKTLADIRKSKSSQVTGIIDPKGASVSGYLAELDPIRLYLNQYMIYNGVPKKGEIGDGRSYTSQELAAVVLHEVGHVFAFMAFLVRFRTDNQILAATARELEGSVDAMQREVIIKEASESLGVEHIDAQSLSHKKNLTVYTVIVSNMARKNRTQSGNGGYDINSFEMLADQFANRHGAGRDLVTALDKMSKGTIYRRGWLSYMFYEFVKIALAMIGISAVATGAVVPGLYMLFAVTSLILADSHNEWYDKTGYRFKRIRNDMIEMLKDPGITKVESARIRYDIDEIEEINKKYADQTQFIGLVYDYLIPSGVSKRKDIEFEQQLESISANKLFYYANQMKNI